MSVGFPFDASTTYTRCLLLLGAAVLIVAKEHLLEPLVLRLADPCYENPPCEEHACELS